jgi:uncharacterized membrane protein SirB2
LDSVEVYLAAKQVHRTAAAVSLVLFVLRAAWTVRGSPRMQRRWVKVVPHVNDTLLLAAAVYMAARIGLQPWILAKMTALLAYVLLGMVALRWAPGGPARALAIAAALAVFGYILAVAFTKRVLPLAV